MDDITRSFAFMIEHAIASGLSFPLYVVSVSANGQVLGLRYGPGPQGLNCTHLCEHTSEDGFSLPVNVYLSDSTGNSMRAVLEPNGGTWWPN